MHSKLKRAKQFIEDKQIWLASTMGVALMNAQQGIAYATTGGGGGSIKVPKITVKDDGSVDLGGGSGTKATDLKQAWNEAMSNSTFVLGAIAMLSSIFIIGYGLWMTKKAAMEIQSGNANGWNSAGNIAKGTIVGGILLAVVGGILVAAAASGVNLFGGTP